MVLSTIVTTIRSIVQAVAMGAKKANKVMFTQVIQMDIQVKRGTMNFLPVREINEKMASKVASVLEI